MNLKEVLFALSRSTAAGPLCGAAEIAFQQLSRYAECSREGLTVIGRMPGEGDRTLMLEAHIDEVAMTVTDIDDNGFITVAKCGGIDLRTLPARPVTIHGKTEIPAVFCSTPPHLAAGETEYGDITEIKLDSLLGAAAKEQISIGDMVTYRAEPVSLAGERITGKSLDNRASVACLLLLAERLSGKRMPVNLVFVLNDQEELGMRGAKTSAFRVPADEAIVLDVSFGDGPDLSPEECGKLSGGAMIGLSPVLDAAISRRLLAIAKDKNIPHQTEVMGFRTGTDADVISVSKDGVRTGLVSIPLRNMHTDVEVVDLDDIRSVCDILEEYILSGGAPRD